MPRCECGRKAITFSPGVDAVLTPGNITIFRAVPDRAWCESCAKARGWLVEPVAKVLKEA